MGDRTVRCIDGVDDRRLASTTGRQRSQADRARSIRTETQLENQVARFARPSRLQPPVLAARLRVDQESLAGAHVMRPLAANT